MKEDIDIKWLEEYAEQEKKYKWGKEIKNLIKRNKELEEHNEENIKALEEWINGERISIHCLPKSKIRELQDKYKNKIEKLESKKIWNEPVDTIIKNRYTNYFNAYEELLEGDK